ncbi:MAG: ATP-dependent Clp protease ATP-binding subunit ClpA [Paracoccaceae bacterium]|jgi:ATP-dependent Clp protease ATP-binding subunit ClpA
MWPALVLVLLFGYGDRIWNLLDSREFELAGVLKLGQQVSQIKENTNEELDDIRALLAAVQSGGGSNTKIVKDIEAKLEKVEGNLDREVRQIRSAEANTGDRSKSVQKSLKSTKSVGASAITSARAQERRGFEALLKRDFNAARKAFDAAFASYPEYHNVKEIRSILDSKRAALTDPRSPEWDKLHQRILTDLSWGMPADLRPRFRDLVTRSYRR